jgi:hypothetical protein
MTAIAHVVPRLYGHRDVSLDSVRDILHTFRALFRSLPTPSVAVPHHITDLRAVVFHEPGQTRISNKHGSLMTLR